MSTPHGSRDGSVPPRPPAGKPQQRFVLRPWVFDVTLAGVLLRAAPRPPVPIPVEAWARAYGLAREPGSGRHTYFDQLTDASGALRLVPGSHHPEQNARLAAYRDRRMPARSDAEAGAYLASFPGYVAGTSPGDVIAFDLHDWHSSAGGRDRPAWTAVYQRCPGTEAECERTLRSMADGFEQQFRGFDRDRYPIWRDWLADSRARRRRAAVVRRMRDAGILDLQGAEAGW